MLLVDRSNRLLTCLQFKHHLLYSLTLLTTALD